MASREEEVRAAFAELARLERHATALRDLARAYLTPSADVPACRDEDPARAAILEACYPPEYAHPEDDDDRGE